MKKRQKAFRDGITAQIREKEQAKMDERVAFFEEGVRLQREARLRRQKLEQVKERKLKELRWEPMKTVCNMTLTYDNMTVYIIRMYRFQGGST